MRNAFAKTLLNLAKKNKDIILITGDLGFSVFEDFINALPKQFLNAGVAEQNMTGLAAGMALEGKIPLIYSIIPFVTMRNYEQIRNDICYQNLNVKIVGVGAGFSYGTYGPTHCAVDDISILRSLPNLTIFSPADPREAEFVTLEAFKINGPVYIRLAKKGEPVISNNLPKLEKFDIAILAHGVILREAVEVSEKLTKKGYKTAVFSICKLWPFDKKLVINLSKKTKAIFTLEEHLTTGGLGSAAAEILAENPRKVIFKRLGIETLIPDLIGTRDFLNSAHGLSVLNIVKTIEKLMQ